ncbi:TniQ protein [Streptomyces sp. 2112.3]|uniref:TniQ family protein n=1 Tax=Streptomyces sp. 2112.3 TaxID=1881023 RepID=UPI0008997632|nr:TniQ family protein [Streptomyces sp. 2112.3]SED28405.1 TniQ protein [Streptomyces sp. 2112.3]
MNQALLTAGCAAAPGALRGGAPAAGAWAQIPLPAPGVFRIRPLAFEATASYLQRLAGAYRLTLPQLLDSAGITVHGHGTPPAAELDLSPTAARRVAAVARVRPHALARALPGLLQDGTTDARPATAYWSPVERRQQAVRACTTCVRHHSRGTADTAWIHRPRHQLVCRRHQQATPDPRLTSTLRTGTAPELTTAHHRHQRLQRHPRSAHAWQAAHAITTRWYDHQQHLTDHWHRRLHQLARTNAHMDRAGNASAVLLARDLVIYPETVTLARTLATLPHPHQAPASITPSP